MRAVGLKVLKNKLREYVRLAASGETVLVTDGDKVVAELVPPRQERSLVLADVYLAEAVRKGWVTPPTLVSSDPPPRRPVATVAEVLQGLDEDRAERRFTSTRLWCWPTFWESQGAESKKSSSPLMISAC